ncbi:MAG: hypothetical protein ACIARR_11340 [Phycisphaerales bacterium JB059]
MAWSIAGWLVFAGGIGLGGWALLWDRSRGRRRCPKCWYDLGGVEPDVEGRWICSECGKVVERARSLRRTRRRWRWVGVAMVLLVASHGLRAVPAVQRNGWIEAVPDVVLVASFPFLSEEQGTGLLSPFVTRPRGGAYPEKALERVARGGWVARGNETRYSWLSRRVAFLLGRFESRRVITDGTTAKGLAYKSALTEMIRSGGAYGFESRWAHSVAWVEFQAPERVGPEELVYAPLRIRRLLLGRYRIRGGWGVADFDAATPSSLWLNGPMPTGSAEEVLAQWVERFQWDHVRPVEGSGPWWNAPGVIPTGVVSPRREGTFGSPAKLYLAENGALRGETDRWERVGTVRGNVSSVVDATLEPKIDSSAEVQRALQDRIVARLVPRADPERRAWTLAVELRLRRYDEGPPVGEALVFGGRLLIEVVNEQEGRAARSQCLFGSASWWRWGTRPADWAGPGEEAIEAELVGRGGTAWDLPGGLEQIGNLPRRSLDGGVVYAVIRADPSPAFHDFLSLRGDTVYQGELRFRLRWSVEELRRFMLSGEVPEHALP